MQNKFGGLNKMVESLEQNIKDLIKTDVDEQKQIDSLKKLLTVLE